MRSVVFVGRYPILGLYWSDSLGLSSKSTSIGTMMPIRVGIMAIK